MTADEETPFEEVILSKLVREIAMSRDRKFKLSHIINSVFNNEFQGNSRR